MSDCNCSICTDTINNPITTYCNHTYCSECLKEWHDMLYPLCRTLFWYCNFNNIIYNTVIVINGDVFK